MESEEEAARGRAPRQNSRSTLRRSPKQRRAVMSELRTLLSPVDTNKRVEKKKVKEKPVVKPRELAVLNMRFVEVDHKTIH